MKIKSVNPYSEKINGEFDPMSLEECDEAVKRARSSFAEWRLLPVSQRVGNLKQVARILRDKKEEYGKIITQEMGKPIRQAVGEIEKCAWVCDYYAENSSSPLQDEIVQTESFKSYVTFEPLGVVLGIMPWNFPFWQVFRYAVPAMAAGNACLLKHASNVPMTAVEIEKIFRDAGFPPGVFQTLLIGSNSVRALIERDWVDAVSLTGSVSAGSDVGSVAGRQIKKLVLELGGSDPFIVLDDADVEMAAQGAVSARTLNAGQSCIAAKRFIVMEAIAERFTERFIDHFQSLRIGDPMQEDTDIGPLARKEFLQGLEDQLEDARQKGGHIIYGRKPPAGKGFFFQPAVVTGVKPDMKVVTEEVFGPVAPIIIAGNEKEVVSIANSTEFGLGASIWTRNLDRAENMARSIEAGFVAINDAVKSDPRLPFGGIKKSGVGRELSHYGLREFVNVKTVVVKQSK